MSIKWGILGTGGIAHDFARDVREYTEMEIAAVGSRSLEKARQFELAQSAFGSYEELVNSDVDAIYVATPHQLHCENTLLALNAGKPVLCEKPFAVSAFEASQMIEGAKANNLLLMEAMWARFLPHMIRVREIIASGILGEIVSVRADHGQWFRLDPEFRLFKPELGGGALFDLGVYPISFAHMVLGSPEKITARSTKAFTGVDGQTSIIMEYKSGAHAILNATNLAATPNRALIIGRDARIEIDRTYYAPTTFRVINHKDEIIDGWDKKYVGHGLREEAIEFARCLRAGEKESPMMPLDETLAVMASIDEVKKQIGLEFPEFIK